MCQVLPKLPDLEQINFGDCLVRTGGAKALAQALRDGQHKLKELILSGNEIKQNGAVAITESMANKADLTLLDLNANQLGEGGIELVQDTMEALGKVELLASFSDDEGSDDEDEEDECDQEDEEEPREDNEGEVNEDPQLQVTGTAITPAKQTITGKEFLAFPSPGKLQQLGPDCVQSMKEAIGADADDPSKVVETVVRVSLVVEENNEKSQKCACEIAGRGQEIQSTQRHQRPPVGVESHHPADLLSPLSQGNLEFLPQQASCPAGKGSSLTA
ncbi:ran GTPase-activating protein 1-like isoform X2 [Babylonia areolata]|uniref:ran GTPase-activating protein 1-like isoform X2 n=1 Tax=Babylonia areolata TaxID=304850 RepID=UPI003FD543DC